MNETRNMILAIALSVLIMLGYEYYSARNNPPPPAQQTTEQSQARPATSDAPGIPGGAFDARDTVGIPVPSTPKLVPAPVTTQVFRDRAQVIADGMRIKITSPRLNGSISLKGGAIDDIELSDYREELDPKSAEIVIFKPKGTENAYFADFGWVSAASVKVPDADTLWTADRDTLSPGNPITLSWDNGSGLKFTRTYAIDKNYMFTVSRQVLNSGDKSVSLFPYGIISRRGTPEVTGYYILHEGLVGVLDGTLSEVKYSDLQESGAVKTTTTGGWLGFTDKYWLAALVPDSTASVKTRFVDHKVNGTDIYQADFLGQVQTIAPGGAGEYKNDLFVGAKEVTLLDSYHKNLGITRFDLAIDFGWLYFLTKPIFYTLIYIHKAVGNFGVAILLLTVLIKFLFFPLANKSYVAMSRMKKLQPEMAKLKERFGDDKTRLNQEIMAFYKREKVNPAAGCLPMIIQIPVFFALYKVLFVTIEMRQAPFFGWIQDLSVRDPTTVFNLFGLLPFTPPDYLMIGAWPLVMGISMFLQQKLNPQPTDNMQAKIFMLLPIVFTFMLARFPAGLVIYWTCNNSITILQQWVIMRRMGVKISSEKK